MGEIDDMTAMLAPRPEKCCIVGCEELQHVETHYPEVISTSGTAGRPYVLASPLGWTIYQTCRAHAGLSGKPA